MSNPIEKSRRNQSLDKYDVSNERARGNAGAGTARRSKAGDFTSGETGSKTFGRTTGNDQFGG